MHHGMGVTQVEWTWYDNMNVNWYETHVIWYRCDISWYVCHISLMWTWHGLIEYDVISIFMWPSTDMDDAWYAFNLIWVQLYKNNDTWYVSRTQHHSIPLSNTRHGTPLSCDITPHPVSIHARHSSLRITWHSNRTYITLRTSHPYHTNITLFKVLVSYHIQITQ